MIGSVPCIANLREVVPSKLALDRKAPEMSGWVLDLRGGICERCQRIEWWDIRLLGSQRREQVLWWNDFAPHNPGIVSRGIGEDAIEEHIIAHSKSGPKYCLSIPKQPIYQPLTRSWAVSNSESWR